MISHRTGDAATSGRLTIPPFNPPLPLRRRHAPWYRLASTAQAKPLMSVFSLYWRVLAELRGHAKLAYGLVIANLVLAAAQFAEPILFGKIIDLMTHEQPNGAPVGLREIWPTVAAWAGFGLFSIVASMAVGLNADRLAHRARLLVMSRYFDHVLNLPLSFHANVHSGRLLQSMLEGASAMFSLWLSFFRENCASFIALFVLLPATLFYNWRLASLLIVMVGVFYVVTAFVLRRTDELQAVVERHNAALASHAGDAFGNVPGRPEFYARPQ